MIIHTLASSSKGNCYLIEVGEDKLLIECGIPFKHIQKGLDFDFSGIRGCIVSHSHKDHCYSAHALQKYCSLPVCVPQSLADMSIASDYKILSPRKYRGLGDFLIQSIELSHDIECLGFIITHALTDDVLFYASDTGADGLPKSIKGLTHLMIETNHHFEALRLSTRPPRLVKRANEYHLGIEAAVRFAERHKDTLQEIHMLHLSDEHADENLFYKQMTQATGCPVYIADKNSVLRNKNERY